MGRKLLLHWIPVLRLIAAGPMEARQLAREGRPATRREQANWGGGFVHQVAGFGELPLQQG